MIELAVQRFAWEVDLDPFETPDPFTQPSFLRGPEFRRHSLAHWAGRLEPLVQRGQTSQEPFVPMWTSRGPGSRHMACLSVLDNLHLLELLARCQAGLQQRFEATDGQQDLCFQMAGGVSWLRSPYSARPYEQAGTEARRKRQAFLDSWQGRAAWHVQADVAGCGTSLDHRLLARDLAECGLDRSARRRLQGLFSRLALGPRYGLRSFGNGLCILVKTYLHPVLLQLLEHGYDALLLDLDEFHLFVDSRAQGLQALELLQRLLGQRALTLNPSKTRLAPLRPAPAAGRGRPWLPQLRDDRFASRGPEARKALHSWLYQWAAWRALSQGRAGDRYQVLYWLERARVRPLWPLRAWLEQRLPLSQGVERDFLLEVLNT